jgi:hypothetical protein
MENYLVSILKYYINYTPNVGEITIRDTLNNTSASDDILRVHGAKKFRILG